MASAGWASGAHRSIAHQYRFHTNARLLNTNGPLANLHAVIAGVLNGLATSKLLPPRLEVTDLNIRLRH
jgi:hypothetical protein